MLVSECPNRNADLCRAGIQCSLFPMSPASCVLLDLSQHLCWPFWKGKACFSIKNFLSSSGEGAHGPPQDASWQKEHCRGVSRYCMVSKNPWEKVQLGGSALQSCSLPDQRREAKPISLHPLTLLSACCPQLAQYRKKCILEGSRWAGCCPLAQQPRLQPCWAPRGRGMKWRKMAQKDGCETGWAAQRLQPKICKSALLQTFVASQWEHFKTLALAPQAMTVGLGTYLFICLLLFINWKWICFYTFKILPVGGEALLSSAPFPMWQNNHFSRACWTGQCSAMAAAPSGCAISAFL